MLSSLVDGYGSSDESDGDNDATAPLVAESAKPAPAADQFKDAEGAEESAKRGRSSSSLPASVRTVPGSLPPCARALCGLCTLCVRGPPMRVRGSPPGWRGAASVLSGGRHLSSRAFVFEQRRRPQNASSQVLRPPWHPAPAGLPRLVPAQHLSKRTRSVQNTTTSHRPWESERRTG